MANEMTAGASFMGTSTNPVTARANSMTAVAQSREMAETYAAMQMAKMCPRDQVAAMDRILNACSRPTLAEVACYTYNRGGTDVTGPSIRLAEAISQAWGNIFAGVRELEQRNGESTCEAFAWDLETNTRINKVFQVPHIRHTRKGDTLLTDPRDIYELVANNGARRLRACILGVIPGDVVDEAVKQCDVTMATKFEVTPERIAGMLKKFEEFSVTKAQIEARVQCHIESIRPAQLAGLGKIYNSIKDGMSKATDWFQPEQAGPTGATGDTGPTVAEGKKSLRDALGIGKKKAEDNAEDGDGKSIEECM